MKTIKFIFTVCILSMLTLTSCKYKSGDRAPETTSGKIDTISYALGMYNANSIKSADFGELNLCQFAKGFKDVLDGKKTKLSEDELMMIIQSHLMARQKYTATKNLEDGKAFFEENKTKEGVMETESGLQYKILVEGTGISPELQDTVEVNYRGSFINGEEFDSSYERGESVKFPLNQVIKGWGEGLTYAKEGGQIEIYVPSNLGYGERSYGPIPGNSTLIFQVDLIKVNKFVEKTKK